MKRILMTVSLTVGLAMGVASAAETAVTVPAARAAAQACEGDCNGDSSVAIDEIILGLRIGLGDVPIGDCRAMDGDDNGAVTVNELVAAVTRALQGCGGPVPPMSTRTLTNTPVPTDTPVAPTSTPKRTDTPVPTNTAVALTSTPTRTDTPVPANTAVAATSTPTRTNTPVPTNTAVAPTSTPTRTNTPVPTNTAIPPTSMPTRTDTPLPTTIDEAALAASTHVGTESIFRLFDLQASLGTAVSVAGRSRAAATGQSAGVSGCQQLDCPLFGTQEDCCSATQFSQFFSNCAFDDDLGRVVVLNGLYVLDSDTADVCTGAIPVGVSFDASLQNFTQDVMPPDHSFSRTFQELSETFQATPGGCAVSQPDQFGFGIRGDGRRFIDGEVQHFQGDGFGNILVDTASEVHGFEIAVGSTQEPDGCAVAAALNGSLTGADFRVGTQFKTDFTDFQVGQLPQAGALVLRLNGTVGTDCLGDVALSTVEPLRVAAGDPCFTAGRLEARLGDGTVSVTYGERGRSDLDFGADGSVDQHFATCTDVPADQCSTTAVGLCGACSALNQCQRGLACFPCSANCSGATSRCTLPDTFATCEDGVF